MRRGRAGAALVAIAVIATPLLAGCGVYIFADVTNGCGTAVSVSKYNSRYFTEVAPGETTRLESVDSGITAWLANPVDTEPTPPGGDDLGDPEAYASVSWEELVEAGANVEGGAFVVAGDLCPEAQR